MAPKLMKTRDPTREVKRIMVALVAAATSGNTFISSIKGPCMGTEISARPTEASLLNK